MNTYFTILVGSLLVNNFVMNKFLGICPFLGVSKKFETSMGMGMAVTFVMTMASFVTWLVNTYLLLPFKLAYMQTIAYILVVAVLVQIVEMALKKLSPSLYQALGVYLPLITTNCAVLGVAINNINDGFTFIESLVSALGVGLGFLLAMVLFSGLRTRIHDANVPAPFRGLPVTLIAASFISLAFMGFGGIVENIFK